MEKKDTDSGKREWWKHCEREKKTSFNQLPLLKYTVSFITSLRIQPQFTLMILACMVIASTEAVTQATWQYKMKKNLAMQDQKSWKTLTRETEDKALCKLLCIFMVNWKVTYGVIHRHHLFVWVKHCMHCIKLDMSLILFSMHAHCSKSFQQDHPITLHYYSNWNWIESSNTFTVQLYHTRQISTPSNIIGL